MTTEEVTAIDGITTDPTTNYGGGRSAFAAADTNQEQGFILWPRQFTRHQLTDFDLKEVRRRSQWLCMNTSARMLRSLARYVGVSSVMPDTLDPVFNKAARQWWKDEYETKAGSYDMSGKFSSGEYLTNCLYQVWRDGDCLSLHLTKRNGEPTCAAIEAARVDSPWNWYDMKWQDGVLTDAFYRRRAFSVTIDPPGVMPGLNNEYVTVGGGNAHFFCENETQASTRGTPALIHAVADLLDEREIHNSCVQTIKAHGLVGYVFERDANTTAGNTLPFTTPGPKRKETIESGTTQVPGIRTAAGTRSIAEVFSQANVVGLDPGMKAKTLTDGRDHPNETEIKNDIYRKLARGLGLPPQAFILLEELTGPGVRFVLRQTQQWRDYWLKSMESFQRVDYARRVEWAIRTGRLPKCKDPNFAKCFFVKPRAVTIDDGRTAQSQIEALKAGITTKEAIYGEMGMDWHEEDEQRANEIQSWIELMKARDIPPEYWFMNLPNGGLVQMASTGGEPDPAEEPTPPTKKPAK